ncbi:Uncharacterised protein [Klebsiella michiganensis]|uniref:Uncharacterized protein n=1 Tax=Klebsiella michiganensis TaxID=1134687 RepID=A0A7H4M147_9ENTR|nr:Uncharacterised protein [Klebsiella michiganensis]
MNTNNIKKYAPQARNQFRDAVIQKLTTLGISADKKGNLQIADAELVGETCAMVSSTTPNPLSPAAIVWSTRPRAGL